MTKQPQVGELVHLNGGSPALTIVSLKNSRDVEVAWIDISLKPRFAVYPLTCLKLIEQEITDEV